MSVTFDLDSSGFRRAIGGLAQFTGASIRPIIRAEAGSILKACVGDTKVASVPDTERRGRLRLIKDAGYTQAPNKGDITVNAGWRPAPYGRVWIKVGSGQKFALAREANFRRSRERFGPSWTSRIAQAAETITSGMTAALRKARGSIGLARQSWVQIADDAGIRLESVPGGRTSAAALAKARDAIASTGVRHANGAAREYVENKTFVLELINGLPYGRKIQLDRILVKNINGRARFFEQNLARGVFDSLAKIARAYPGLRITAGVN